MFTCTRAPTLLYGIIYVVSSYRLLGPYTQSRRSVVTLSMSPRSSKKRANPKSHQVKSWPTHFLSLRINSPSIHDNISILQDKIVCWQQEDVTTGNACANDQQDSNSTHANGELETNRGADVTESSTHTATPNVQDMAPVMKCGDASSSIDADACMDTSEDSNGVKENGALRDCCYQPTKAHITVFVMSLKDESEEEKAMATLRNCADDIATIFPVQGPTINVGGLHTFTDRRGIAGTLFAGCREAPGDDGKLHELYSLLESRFIAEELLEESTYRTFKPHVTLLKISQQKNRNKNKRIKSIPSACYEEHVAAEFGTHTLSEVQLVRMKEKGEDGFFRSIETVTFGSGDL